MVEERLVQMNVRISRKLKKLIIRFVELNAYKDVSEFARVALREKLQRDAPELYSSLFKE